LAARSVSKSAEAFRTIREVSEWLGLETHVLRFWESKFPQVRPVRLAGERRYYRVKDMLILGGIKKLLREDGMTIKGVQNLIKNRGVQYVVDLAPSLDSDVSLDYAVRDGRGEDADVQDHSSPSLCSETLQHDADTEAGLSELRQGSFDDLFVAKGSFSELENPKSEDDPANLGSDIIDIEQAEKYDRADIEENELESGVGETVEATYNLSETVTVEGETIDKSTFEIESGRDITDGVMAPEASDSTFEAKAGFKHVTIPAVVDTQGLISGLTQLDVLSRKQSRELTPLIGKLAVLRNELEERPE